MLLHKHARSGRHKEPGLLGMKATSNARGTAGGTLAVHLQSSVPNCLASTLKGRQQY
jgi:hypothetical protein